MRPYTPRTVIVRFASRPVTGDRWELLSEKFGSDCHVIETNVPSDQRVTQAEVIAAAFEHRADFIVLDCQATLLTKAALAEAMPERVIMANYRSDDPNVLEPAFQGYVVLRNELEVDEF